MTFKIKVDRYFLGISDDNIREQKTLVRKVKQDTVNMLRAEAKKLIKDGFYDL